MINRRMFFANLYKQPKRTLSFEFFPPRQEQDLPEAKRMLASLARFKPCYVTVTSGAEPIKRSLCREMVYSARKDLGLPVIAHQTCWGLSKEEIDASLDELSENGINLVLALRGDPSKKFSSEELARRGFENALEFTRHIAAKGNFEVAVAGYPETHKDAESPTSDLEYLKQKVEVGAQIILTQLFFDPAVFFRFLENTKKLGITVPIIPGILPISSATQLERFTSLTGASIPDTVREAVNRYSHDSHSLAAWGIEYAINQCRTLLEGGAAGIHLYTLNKEAQTAEIATALQPILGAPAQS